MEAIVLWGVIVVTVSIAMSRLKSKTRRYAKYNKH
jgi:hypothetical protein